jgi:hypothetical protein
MRLLAALMVILGIGLVPALAQPADDAPKPLHGAWTAAQAVRDGKPAEDVVGNRLSFTGSQFQIQSKDGKPLFTGTIRWMRRRSPPPSISSTRKATSKARP